MKRIVLLLCIIYLSFPACRDAGTSPPLVDDRLEISEAVFRHQFEHNESGQQQSATFYFISYIDRADTVNPWKYLDVPPALLGRFAGMTPRVKNASACTTSIEGCIDRETGQYGLLFRIESIEMKSADEAEVKGGYFEGGLSASGNIYTVQRKNGAWIVVKDVMIWIS